MQGEFQTSAGNQDQDRISPQGKENTLDGQNSGIKPKTIGQRRSGDKETTKERGASVVSCADLQCSPNDDQQNKDGNILQSVSPKVLNQAHGEKYSIYNGDSVEVIKGIPDNSIHFQVMSPPFADLFVYSNSNRDLGNCKSDEEFFAHYQFLVREQFRVAIPGRLCAIHVMQLPTSKVRHGMIGIRDFRGACIREFVKAGWIYHSEVCIWKNPVTAMQRTKALGLLHKQLKKDSCMSRNGIADYLCVFRKPGENPERVQNTNATFPVSVWQRYASPVWASIEPQLSDDGFLEFEDASHDDGDEGGIAQGNTLQGRSAREHADERHLCCLQLGVIRRALKLWSNPNDIVASWFLGIGSEGFASIEQGRRFIGCELKPSYFAQAKANLQTAHSKTQELSLF